MPQSDARAMSGSARNGRNASPAANRPASLSARRSKLFKNPRRRASPAFCALALILATPARAGDSSAQFATGGLALVDNPHIQMAEEDLYLSRAEVRVRSTFVNQTDHDIETIVAFPMPSVRTRDDRNYSITWPDPVDFIDFRLGVNGTAIKPSVEVKVTSFGLDITQLLRKYDLPFTAVAAIDLDPSSLHYKLNHLPIEAVEDLLRHDAISQISFGDGTRQVDPSWTAHITYYWHQRFPAGKRIEITHSYRPMASVGIIYPQDVSRAANRKKFCVADAEAAAAARLGDRLQSERKKPTAEGNAVLWGTRLRYVLSTAMNWRGSIGAFNLTIDKGSPEAVLSTCFKGLKQTGPTTFRATQSNYQALHDIGLLIMDRPAR